MALNAGSGMRLQSAVQQISASLQPRSMVVASLPQHLALVDRFQDVWSAAYPDFLAGQIAGPEWVVGPRIWQAILRDSQQPFHPVYVFGYEVMLDDEADPDSIRLVAA